MLFFFSCTFFLNVHAQNIWENPNSQIYVYLNRMSQKGLIQLNDLIKDPADFAGDAVSQSKEIAEQINKLTKGEIKKVELEDLI